MVLPSDRLTPVTQAVKDKILANVARLGLTSADVYWPDQQKIPRTPAICIDSGDFQRTLSGIGGKGRTDNAFTVFLICYLCKVQDIQLTEKSVEQFSEQIMDVLHQDVTMGGIVTHGFVTKIEPGYASRNGILFRSARITWEGMSKTVIA